MVFVNDRLQEEKLLLQAGILPFEFMHIVGAKLQYFNLLSNGVQYGVAHKERTRIDT